MNLALAKALDRTAGGVVAAAFRAVDAVGDLVRPAPPPLEDVRAFLVVKFWGIGNWALLRPVVADLRDRWPRARCVVVTLDVNLPFAADLADEVLEVRAGGWARLARDLSRALSRLRRRPPDLSLDFEQFARAGGLLARAARVPQRLGFSTGQASRDALYTARVPFRRDAHASRSFRDLAEAAGVEPGPYVPGRLAPTAAGLDEARSALAGLPAGPLVVLHPGSGDNFPGRRWSEAGFAAVGRQASLRHGARVVVCGTAPEAALCGRVAAGCAGRSLAGALSLPGYVGLLSRAAAVVANDTGPVHLASALGRPVLALFGPNTPVLYGPLSPGSRAFFRGLPCSPCLTESNYRSSRCRLHTCMQAIATGEVVAALDSLLRKEAPWAAASSSR